MIEIGDYIRTKQGEIAKIVDTNMFNKTIYKDAQDARYYLEDIVKHSKNIIDLIEVGDMLKINDEKYEVIFDKSYGKLGVLIPSKKELAIRHSAIEFIFQNNNAVSIVTKEQFESVSYKV